MGVSSPIVARGPALSSRGLRASRALAAYTSWASRARSSRGTSCRCSRSTWDTERIRPSGSRCPSCTCGRSSAAARAARRRWMRVFSRRLLRKKTPREREGRAAAAARATEGCTRGSARACDKWTPLSANSETLTFNCQEVCSVSSVLHAASVDAPGGKRTGVTAGSPRAKSTPTYLRSKSILRRGRDGYILC